MSHESERKPTHEEIAILANRMHQEAMARVPSAEVDWFNAENELLIELNRGQE